MNATIGCSHQDLHELEKIPQSEVPSDLLKVLGEYVAGIAVFLEQNADRFQPKTGDLMNEVKGA